MSRGGTSGEEVTVLGLLPLSSCFHAFLKGDGQFDQDNGTSTPNYKVGVVVCSCHLLGEGVSRSTVTDWLKTWVFFIKGNLAHRLQVCSFK